jgi:tetratricopeptide (TPR) repeat protein
MAAGSFHGAGRSRKLPEFPADSSRGFFQETGAGGGPIGGSMITKIAWFAACFAVAAVGCKGTAPLPARAAELNSAGIEALERGDLETAEARFALALEYSNNFVEALVNQALVEMQRGNFENARRLLKRARRLNPDVAQPHHGLGVLAERERRPDQASEHYAEALRVDPGFAPARANLGRLLFDAGMFEHARVQFKRLVEVAPEQPAGYSGLVETLIQLGRHDEADAVLGEGLLHFAEDPSLLILLARANLRVGRFDAAIALLEPIARERDDMAVAALGWIATTELARGRARQAAAAARRAVGLEPNDSLAVFALARALAALEDPEAAAWAARAKQLGAKPR